MSPALVEPGAPLSPGDRARFGRHLSLPGLADEGQRRLLSARVLVVGAGGLGAPVLLYLAAAGVRRITIVDDDRVELSNLQRQVLHGSSDVGRAKVDSATEALRRLDPAVDVHAVSERLTSDTALRLLAGHDVVVDGSDNFATRYLVGDACEILGVPVVWGAILQYTGQISVFWAGRGPTYRDLYPEAPDPLTAPSCAAAGVLGSLCGVIGSTMASEVVKLITGIGEPLVGRLLIHDALSTTWRELTLTSDPARTPVTSIGPHPAMCGAPLLRADDLPEALALGAVLVDVREPEEASAHPLPGALLHPQGDILDGTVELPHGRPLVLCCASGVRSRRVAEHLMTQGYTDVHSLDGGIAR